MTHKPVAVPYQELRSSDGQASSRVTNLNPKPLKTNTPGSCLYQAKSQKKINLKDLEKHIGLSDMVYVGESHDQIKDHMAQLKALKLLYLTKEDKIAVGFEMLNFTLQPILDDYAEGKITETDFLEKANWKKNGALILISINLYLISCAIKNSKP